MGDKSIELHGRSYILKETNSISPIWLITLYDFALLYFRMQQRQNFATSELNVAVSVPTKLPRFKLVWKRTGVISLAEFEVHRARAAMRRKMDLARAER